MKHTLTIFATIAALVLNSSSAFAQNAPQPLAKVVQPHVDAPYPLDESYVQSIQDDMHVWLTKYKTARANHAKIVQELNQAVLSGDGKATILALNDLRSNMQTLSQEASSAMSAAGWTLLRQAKLTLELGRINPQQNRAHLEAYQKAKEIIEEPDNAELPEIILKARDLVPDYFVLCEKYGIEF